VNLISLDRDINKVSGMNMTKIFDYSSNSDNASFQWNISIPITILVLVFMGYLWDQSNQDKEDFQ